MFRIRRSQDRFHTKLSWLDSRHTFSFGHHYDPAHLAFKSLRVINDDLIEPGKGFSPHGHRDMEIITYILEGSLVHQDSIGFGSVIRRGEVQRMSAGSGVMHSEKNPDPNARTRLLQIWITPEKRNLVPTYEQKRFDDVDLRDTLRLIGSLGGREGSVLIHQDADLWAGRFSHGHQQEFVVRHGRAAWLHVARGSVRLNGHELAEGDGASTEGSAKLSLSAHEESEVLLFDLAAVCADG